MLSLARDACGGMARSGVAGWRAERQKGLRFPGATIRRIYLD